MFKFLKLRNSVSGDARRHVPFTSIIHKPLFLFFVFLFSFVCIVPIKVSAAAPQITPQFKPILDTDIVNFQDSYLNLDPAAQAAASLLFGAYVTEYAGLADYGYVFDDVPSEASFKDRLIFIGDQLVDTLFLPVNMADQLVLSPLIDLGQGIINKVKNVNSVDGFYNDILNADDYGLSYTPDIGFALNQVFAKNGGLNNWQYSVSDWDLGVFHQTPLNASGTYLTEYQNYYGLMPQPTIPLHSYDAGYYPQGYIISFDSKYDLFINSTNHTIGFVTSNQYPVYGLFYDPTSPRVVYRDNGVLYFNTQQYDPSIYNRPADVARYFLNNYVRNNALAVYNASTGYGSPQFSRILNRVLYGNSLDNAVEIFNETDLGFIDTPALEYLNPVEEAIFDLKQLVEQIVENQPDPNLEIPLKPIIYNVTQVNGSPLTVEDLQGISFNVTPPESGIDVPANVFLPFFDNGKGFISYMWYMTKPLVMYTRSFLDAITFDPVEGFNASGPGYFILGVAAIGLIGGVVVKFLL